ncbi:hypothetical protein GOP47_0002533 [Adiantum capillus-veneris]|uniref:tRNA-dihydrouridine(16/17) synthase [NAD(P)(+)] n=1 Tax=Adiantum capillus-veneris TaxID=13818 RepID=A0A9D4VB43_ADICA|nr:hypothetical protein GOP47_0002533 [Adiantum capillus-veneris]
MEPTCVGLLVQTTTAVIAELGPTSKEQATTAAKSECDSSPCKKLKTEAAMPMDRIEKAWDHWKKLGEPKLIVAPMVDQSELPFRMLCRKYGATAAYTPMLHSRLFADCPKYRSSEFTTCPEDRPLFVQFCANDPEKLLAAAQVVEPFCDYVDINLGCPQRIAKRGNYGAFLMDDLPLVRSLVEKLALNLSVPVSCKIRIFPKLEDTLAYAHMLEEAGCSLLAVHGRTRDQKDGRVVRADWSAIKAVKEALTIPVLANGNIRCLEDVHECLRETGADGVLSAESLLENPALFAGYRLMDSASDEAEELEDSVELYLDQPKLFLEYLEFLEKYPVPWRMVRAHVHRMLGNWFKKHPDIREDLNKEFKLSKEFLEAVVQKLRDRNERVPLTYHDQRGNLAVKKKCLSLRFSI